MSAVDGVDIVAGTNEKSHLTDYVAEFMQENGMRQLHIKGYEELDVYDETGTVVEHGKPDEGVYQDPGGM